MKNLTKSEKFVLVCMTFSLICLLFIGVMAYKTFQGLIVLEQINQEQLRFINETSDTVNSIDCNLQSDNYEQYQKCMY